MNLARSVYFHLAISFCSLAVPAFAADLEVQAAAGAATWQIEGQRGVATLIVHGAGGAEHRASFPAGVAPIFSPPGDGVYEWQLQVAPPTSAVRRGDGAEPAPVPGGFVEEGRLVVENGMVRVLPPGDSAGPDGDDLGRQLIADNLMVQGSLCVGLDCTASESFGFDTIRLKENSLRIKFEDTSVGAFPTNDWQLTANDSASGGQSKFSIEDITGARVPFTVEAGATTNSIFVDSTGRVGFRTATPVLDLHVATSNTPAIRLEQTSAGGFTAQTWDIGANEANFFVRDATSSSKMPFRIRPGAPTSSIDIRANGDIGFGTSAPAVNFHFLANTGLNSTVAIFENNEAARMDLFVNSSVNGGAPTTWFWQADNDANRTFKISKQGGGGTIVTINNRLDANGVTFKVDGSIQATNVIFPSSRSFKTDFVAVSAKEVLEKVAGLDIGQWRFLHEQAGTRHIGPIAEDFAAAFGLGATDGKHINVTDINGVALKAIQGLYQEMQQRLGDLTQQMERLQRENSELRALVSVPQ
jgi:hypothetical protein